MFPAGVPGVALLVLRNCVAVALAGSAFPTGWQHAAFLGFLGMLVIGMFTPVICGLASVLLLFDLVRAPHTDIAKILVVALSALSLACLGPGAFSVDARIFGRRILISTSSSSPTDNGQP
jgi:hypothetical protein